MSQRCWRQRGRLADAALTPATLGEAARQVLLTANPADKAASTRILAARWRAGAIAHAFPCAMPERPARPARPELLPPSMMPKRGRA